MFTTRTTVFVALAVFLVGQVLASPLPRPLQAIEARDVPLDVISAYVKRQQDINSMPEQTPSKGTGPGAISAYKRQDINSMPEQTPSKGTGPGAISAYKRQDVNSMPEQTPSKGTSAGLISPYKRQVPRRLEMSASDVN